MLENITDYGNNEIKQLRIFQLLGIEKAKVTNYTCIGFCGENIEVIKTEEYRNPNLSCFNLCPTKAYDVHIENSAHFKLSAAIYYLYRIHQKM